MSNEYYEPAGFALEIFKKRYARHEEETWQEACDRVATHVAAAETNGHIAQYQKEFGEILKRNLFFPGGRIWYGSGRPKGQLLNCFVIPTKDSREGWGKTASDTIVISGTGGGVGTNYSPIRPRNSKIAGTGGVATGAVSLMRGINAFGEEMKAGGGRRVALMMALNITHGDIVEFLDTKLDLKKLNNANVSTIFDEDPEDFFALVKAGADLELKHMGKVVGKAPAAELWKKIVSNALKSGEPGLLNGYLANRMNNVWYFKPVICTNPCGEIWLVEYDCCDLGALVLPRFIINGKFDRELLKSVIKVAVRFLDDVLSVNNYPMDEIKEMCSQIRRIGLGVTGLSTMLLQLGMRYNSTEALEFVDSLMNFIKNCAYEASIELAEEKGSFPVFDAEKFLKGGFIKTLKPSIRDGIKKKGIRNCALLTIAPVGTGSIVCDVDSGIEPSFGPGYKRTFRDGDDLKTEVVVHSLFKKMRSEGKDVSHFQTSYQLQMRDHFEMQRTCQRHIDNAVSKTINVPPGTSEQELSDLYMEYFPELKGVTVYPEGSRENQPITPMSFEDVLPYIGSTAVGASSDDGCSTGACEVPWAKDQK
jgi:ribonucleoside-diphosphate reductase alpha chain